MKLLYIDICARHLNPTNTHIPAMLRVDHEALFYGPGFVSDEDLSGGIERFVERNGPFDFVLTTKLDWKLTILDCSFLRRYSWPVYSDDVLIKFADDVAAYFWRAQSGKIIFLTAIDAYALSEAMADRIANADAHFMVWSNGFSRPTSELTVFTKEEFYARKKDRRLGLWHDFVHAHAEKFINIGHFIADDEFSWTALSCRAGKVIVPGQGYFRRRVARAELRREGLLRRSGSFRRAMALMDHLGLRPYSRPLLQNAFHVTFRQAISSARYAYTDGYGYDRPVRKFFEIPALGTVLLCTPCAGFEALGFVDRGNAVAVSDDGVGDAVRWLEAEPEVAQRIADGGRDLIWRRHSLTARAKQLTQCLEAIAAGAYRGSRWQSGEFIVERSGASNAVEPTKPERHARHPRRVDGALPIATSKSPLPESLT